MELLKINEVRGVDHTLVLESHNGYTAHIEIDNPWSGDTESGFGHSTSFTLTKEQACELAGALLKWADA